MFQDGFYWSGRNCSDEQKATTGGEVVGRKVLGPALPKMQGDRHTVGDGRDIVECFVPGAGLGATPYNQP